MADEWLEAFASGFGVFGYITWTILAVLTALAISLLAGPLMIRRLTQHQIGQAVRSDGPQSHLSKAGTPTMGGALIIVAIVLSTLLWSDLGNRFVWLAIVVILAFGAVGWVDDYRKVVRRDPAGLAARWKYLWQSVGHGCGGRPLPDGDEPGGNDADRPLLQVCGDRSRSSTSCLRTS